MSFSFRNSLSALKHREGFTLLEVLIAMALLVVISFAIYQATTETFRLRDVIMNEGEFYNGIRLAMGIVDRDVQLLYSPVVLLPPKEQPNPSDRNAALAAQQSEVLQQEEFEREGLDRPSDFWEGAVDSTGLRPSRFVGTDRKMTFVSASNIRVYKEARASDFAKITYEIKPDRNDRENGTQVLLKTENVDAFSDDDRPNSDKEKAMVRTYPLLYGIKKLRFRYYWKDKDRWVYSWDSDSSDTKNLYPDIIEIQVEVTGPSRLNFQGTYHFRPALPMGGVPGTL
jgi:prepilin-type N-terminal cleavage/methylation domain-containing protein